MISSDRRLRNLWSRRGRWNGDLERWLAPFVARLRHKARRRMCPLYVAGLIGRATRKSVEPMAARAEATWRLRPVAPFHCERRLGRSAAEGRTRDPGGPKRIGGPNTVLVVPDDTARRRRERIRLASR